MLIAREIEEDVRGLYIRLSKKKRKKNNLLRRSSMSDPRQSNNANIQQFFLCFCVVVFGTGRILRKE